MKKKSFLFGRIVKNIRLAKIRLLKTPIFIESGKITENSVSFLIERDGLKEKLYLKSNHVRFQNSPDVPLLIVLLQAMKRKRNIFIRETISNGLIVNLIRYMDIFCTWHSSYRPIKIHVNNPPGQFEKNSFEKSRRVGAFFSGGVDSFYTFFKHKDEITDLIFVHGFDVPLSSVELRQQIREMGSKVAAEWGKRFVEIETNARDILKGWGHWGFHAHGLALGTVARSLSGSFQKIFIASSTSIDQLRPWGSHPELDNLLGDRTIEIIHDGVQKHRNEKIEYSISYPFFLENLRVCYKNPGEAYNCCECEKCLRTMTTLYALGCLDKAIRFPKPLNARMISRLELSDAGQISFVNYAIANLQLLRENGMANSEVYNAWHDLLARYGH